MNRLAFIFMLLLLFFTTNTYADHYTIVFHEGAHAFDYKKPFNDLHNKYLADVLIYKNDQLLNDVYRGSTLSDSIFLYELYYDGIIYRSPTDKNIQNIFESWPFHDFKICDNINLENNIKDIMNVVCYLQSIPVVYSGRYKFILGLHRDGKSEHGQPYVPRLCGTTDKDNPYNPISSNITDDTLKGLDGGWVATINKNKEHMMKKVAIGINIHKGRYTQNHRDSEGCLTINPDHWDNFITKFPDIKDWSNHTGEVVIFRDGFRDGDRPPSPYGFRLFD